MTRRHPATAPLRTLGAQLLRHAMVPLAATWLLGTAAALVISFLFTQRAFDRALLDDAHLIAANVVVAEGRVRLALTEREVRSGLFDSAEKIVFGVTDGQGRLIAGDARLPRAFAWPDAADAVADIELDGEQLRAARLHRDEPVAFDVVVAETKGARRALAQRLLAYSTLPQVLLLLLVAWWLRRVIQQEMRPLGEIQDALDLRDASDLAPVPVQTTSRDLERLTTALNSLLGRLDQSVRAQREFAGNVAHELRTPLAGIRALAEYGLSQREPTVWREQLERIVASQARASRTVDQLLALALALEAQSSLKLMPVALDTLVHAAVMRFLPRADAAGVDLGARGVDQAISVTGDATLIENLLNNLLDNALRYGVDRPNPTVTVAVERQAGEVVVSVIDNGSGLPGEQQAQLLQRGAQGETGQLLGQGAGIGLALVAQYAALMGARIELGRGPGGMGWACSIRFRGT